MQESINNSYLSGFIQLYKESFSGLSADIWWLTIMALINRTGTVVIFFLSIYLTEQLHFTKIQAGIAFSCHGFGSVAGSYLGGILSDKFGYYKVMFWSLLSVGILFVIMMFIKQFEWFCIMMFITTTVGDSFRPASQVAIGAYSTPENHTRSLSLYRMAINLGFAVGAGGAGFIAGWFGYHWLFIIDGGTCILAAFFLLWALKEKEEVLSDKDEAEKIIKRSVYQDHWFLMLIGFLLLGAIAFMQLFHTFPLFCREELLFSEEQIGALFTFNGLLICIIEMPLVFVLVKLKKEVSLIIWGTILFGLSYVCFNVLGFTPWVAILSMVFVSIGEIINFPFSNTLALQRSTVNNRGQYMALFSMMFSVAFIIAPMLGMYLIENFGYTVLWNVMGMLCGVSAFGLLILNKKRDAMTEKFENKVQLS